MSAGWIEICWSSGFVGPVDYTKSVMWVDFRWVDYNAGGSRSVGPVDREVLGRWIEECWAGGLRSVGPVDCRSGGLRFVATVDSERPSPPPRAPRCCCVSFYSILRRVAIACRLRRCSRGVAPGQQSFPPLLRITRRRQSKLFQRRPRDRSPAPREGLPATTAALERC